MEKDYYNILGIPRNSKLNIIKKAFRLKAREYHPDVNKSPDAARKFKEIHEAYEFLTQNFDELYESSSYEKCEQEVYDNCDYSETGNHPWHYWDYWDPRYNWYKHYTRPQKKQYKYNEPAFYKELFMRYMYKFSNLVEEYFEIFLLIIGYWIIFLLQP